MARNSFEDSRNSEGTRQPGSNPSIVPDRESSAISRDDERDGAPVWEHDQADPGDPSGDKHQPSRSIEFEKTSGYRAGTK